MVIDVHTQCFNCLSNLLCISCIMASVSRDTNRLINLLCHRIIKCMKRNTDIHACWCPRWEPKAAKLVQMSKRCCSQPWSSWRQHWKPPPRASLGASRESRWTVAPSYVSDLERLCNSPLRRGLWHHSSHGGFQLYSTSKLMNFAWTSTSHNSKTGMQLCPIPTTLLCSLHCWESWNCSELPLCMNTILDAVMTIHFVCSCVYVWLSSSHWCLIV